ncbi:MAG: hypothetical protein AB1422_17175 [bacterium]
MNFGYLNLFGICDLEFDSHIYVKFRLISAINHIEDVTRNIEMVIEEISTPLIPRQRGELKLAVLT